MSKQDYTIVNVAIRLIRMISLQFICYNGRQKTCMPYRLFEIRKIAVCFLSLLLQGDYRVTDEALLAETT